MIAKNSVIEPGIMISHRATESYLAQVWQDLSLISQETKIWYSTDPDALDAGPFASQIERQIESALAGDFCGLWTTFSWHDAFSAWKVAAFPWAAHRM
jgi:hypothetical protein